MLVTTKAKFVRISPKKMRTVLPLIRSKNALRAEAELRLVNRKAAGILSKVLKAAMADAEHNYNLKKDTLVVKEAVADQGPSFKRFMPRARGSASSILKRTSHIKITLEGTETGKAVKKQALPVDVSWEEIEKSAEEARKAAKAEDSATATTKTAEAKTKEPEAKTESLPTETKESSLETPKESWNDQFAKGSKDVVKKFFRRKTGQ